jgi:hypothetical protein
MVTRYFSDMSRKNYDRPVNSATHINKNKEEIRNTAMHSMPNGMATKIILYFGVAIGMLVLSTFVIGLLTLSTFILGI